jgi:hypothetical protein
MEMPRGQQLYIKAHGVRPEDLSRNIQYRNSGVLPPRPRAAMKRIEELVEKAVEDHGYQPGTKVAIYLSFPFSSRRSDVDGPIKRTIDAVQAGIRAARPDDRPAWNDRYVETVQASRVPKDQPLKITLYNLPE